MAWTKSRTVISGVMILAVAASGLAAKWFFFPAIKDNYFKSSYQSFQQVPGNLLVVRPTHFSLPTHGTSYSGGTRSPNGTYLMRMMGRNVPLAQVIASAYQCNPSRIILPPEKTRGNFDFLVTVPDKPQERFQAAIRKHLGYAAHWESRDADVLLLETRTPEPPGLHVSSNGNGNITYRDGKYQFTHLQLASVTGFLESALKQPVLDRTGLTNFYDFAVAMNWRTPGGPDATAMEKSLDDLGLKLEPGNAPMQMLVVEKAR